MMTTRRMLLAGAVALLVAAPVVQSRATGTADTDAVRTVRAFYAQLTSTMHNGPSLGFAGRRNQLEGAVKSAFDLPRMTQLAVGPRWQSLSAQQRADLVVAFGNYSAATYASRFTHDNGGRFEIEPNVTPTTGGSIVHTKLVRKGDDPVQLDYLMKQADGGWKIEDVYLSGTISELATRRSEFTAVLDRGGAQALVEALRKKAAGENG